jgi:hypothetical protein
MNGYALNTNSSQTNRSEHINNKFVIKAQKFILINLLISIVIFLNNYNHNLCVPKYSKKVPEHIVQRLDLLKNEYFKYCNNIKNKEFNQNFFNLFKNYMVSISKITNLDCDNLDKITFSGGGDEDNKSKHNGELVKTGGNKSLKSKKKSNGIKKRSRRNYVKLSKKR